MKLLAGLEATIPQTLPSIFYQMYSCRSYREMPTAKKTLKLSGKLKSENEEKH
jgi:hypothetical protein